MDKIKWLTASAITTMRNAVTEDPPTPVLGEQVRQETRTLAVQAAMGVPETRHCLQGTCEFCKKQQESLGC